MRVHCKLRTLREEQRTDDGKHVSISAMAKRTEISGGILSLIERGVMLPADRQVAVLEAAYGAPLEEWYQPRLLLALEHDPAEEGHG